MAETGADRPAEAERGQAPLWPAVDQQQSRAGIAGETGVRVIMMCRSGAEPRVAERAPDEGEAGVRGGGVSLGLHDLEAPHAFTCRAGFSRHEI